MRSLFYVFALVFVAGTAVWAYSVNYKTRAALERVEALRAEITRQNQALDVLRIEWAWLNAPDRLETLVAENRDKLALAPMSPQHFGEATNVSFPKPAEPRPTLPPMGASPVPEADDGLDDGFDENAPMVSVPWGPPSGDVAEAAYGTGLFAGPPVEFVSGGAGAAENADGAAAVTVAAADALAAVSAPADRPSAAAPADWSAAAAAGPLPRLAVAAPVGAALAAVSAAMPGAAATADETAPAARLASADAQTDLLAARLASIPMPAPRPAERPVRSAAQ